MGYASFLGQGAELVVGEVAGHVAESLAATVAAYDGSLADFERVEETLFAGMAQVYHDALAVHLTDDLLAKLAHAVVGVAAFGAVADVVVAIVAQGDVYYPALREVFHVGDVVIEGNAVLYAKHDGLAPFALVFKEVGRRTGDADVLAVAPHDGFYLVENEIGILHGGVDIEMHF